MFEFHWATLVLMGLACFFMGGIAFASASLPNNDDPH